jgi:hypothetical protein
MRDGILLLTTFLLKNGIAENDLSVGERCAPAGVPVLAGYRLPGKPLFSFLFFGTTRYQYQYYKIGFPIGYQKIG